MFIIKMLEKFSDRRTKLGFIIILSIITIITFIIILNRMEGNKDTDKNVAAVLEDVTEETTIQTEDVKVTTTITKVTEEVTTIEAQTEESVTETQVETEAQTEALIIEDSVTEPTPRTKWTVQTVSPDFNNAFSDILSYSEYPESYEIDVKCVYQNPELPTGCEITSLTTVLNYFGYAVGKMEMANNYLIKANYGTTDFSTAFIGNPQTTRGYGCYSPVIVNTAQKFLNEHGNMHSVVNLSGYELSELFKIISNDYPIVIWCTMSLVEPKEVYVWTLAGNIDVYWMQNEHCVVLTGYNLAEGTVTVSDPLKGIVKYNLQEFEKRFIQLGKQAVAIK